jgi:transglutaminase-like putative cysteine protease
MGIKVALEHRTSYTFDRLVEVFPHVVRLRPAPHSRTPIEAYSLQVEPADHFVNWQQDAFGNFLARLVFPDRARSLTITVGLIADLKVVNPFDFFIEDWAEQIGFGYPKALAEDLEPYLRPVDEADDGTEPGDLTAEWVRNFAVAPDTRTIDFLVALVDMATGTSRGGCTYHVSHPGGRSYNTPPVDTSDIREKQARQATDVGAPGIVDLRRVRTVLH